MSVESKRLRVDELLVERGLVPTQEQARRHIMAGEVIVNGQVVFKPATLISIGAQIRLKERSRFVSRGGEKLLAAMERFQIDPSGWVCADVGSSTGGFTDCLLQLGAEKVYAIDAGYGQLAWSLRQDKRVAVMERTNARYLETLPEPIDLVSVDVSFISLSLILQPVHNWLKPSGQGIVLIKPQFEAHREDVSQGGVVRDRAVHEQVLIDTIDAVSRQTYYVYDLMPSPLKGPAGNVEFLMWLGLAQATRPVDVTQMIRSTLKEAHEDSSPSNEAAPGEESATS